MRQFNYLYMTVQAIKNITFGILNKVLTLGYLMLPIGLFLLIMQLRTKNNKATAIGAFTDENSEFQFIFPEYILVANKPASLKVGFKHRMGRLNNFIDKWKWLIIVGLLAVIGVSIIITLFALR